MIQAPEESRTGACRSVASAFPVHVTWTLPDAADHRHKLDLACAGAGPVVVQGVEGSGTRAESRGGKSLVLVSWNTYLGRGNLSELVARLERGEFTGNAPVARFALLLQEVYRTSILAFARERGLYAVYAPARLRRGDADDRGAAILATSPIEAIAIVELPFEKQRRIALGARVDGIELVNVHFDTAVGILRGGPGSARRRQARAVIDAVSDVPAPLVLGGDLNTWWGDDEPAVEELRRAFPDATAAGARETWRGPLWTGNKLDYVFAKGFEPAVTIRRLDSRYGSDHWPLMTIVPIEGIETVGR
jgi:endonuclease/exonuclease/phosphatase family metal-dependent hydrolase